MYKSANTITVDWDRNSSIYNLKNLMVDFLNHRVIHMLF